MKFTRYQCWKTERVGRVIAKAALDIDRSTFLATHMPMREIVYEKSPLEIENTSEQNLLAELERMTQEDQHVFAVVKGIPGTGKSHLIRWLFERYKQQHPEDRVLLIERANASLRKTIQQIIDSGVFQSPKLNEQLNQLRNATSILSSEGLADTLLNNLQVATSEVTWHEKLHRRISAERISTFLLDQTVREHFKRPDGPIERVVKYLQEGRGIRSDEVPGFKPEELVLDPQQRGKISHEGYRNVQEVADDISRDNSKQRDQLTRYLNFLLTNYAISRTANLTSSDLREMFNELRRHLQQQKQNLALFIEDITAFTGIDAGLIDVLITQHTGGANRAFCRLTSVIGITDAYFTDNLPDNVRERITHQLTLNAKAGVDESDMLRDGNTIVEFAARYLNAIRLDEEDLERWEKRGAIETSLPNACISCRFREPCHNAFGYANISIEVGDTQAQVGLYPFNSTALVRMYRNLDSKYSRTPRSLLDNILSYILQSYGEQVVSGRFPPPPNKLVPSVVTQEFEPTAHARIVDQQGEQDAERLKTLFLYWGDKNVYKYGDHVGGLSPQVFEALALPVIDGRTDNMTDGSGLESGMIPGIAVADGPPAHASAEIQTLNAPDNPLPPIKTQSDYIDDISRWASDGYLPSQVANQLVQWLALLFQTGIEWEAYDLSLNHFPSPSRASTYFAIEGQAARIRGQLVFTQSSSLRYALDAVANLNDRNVELTPAQYGEHLVAIETWLQQEEKNIVDYVRLRAPVEVESNLLTRLLVQNAILLACLAGDLSERPSIADLFQQIIAFSTINLDLQETKWKKIASDNNLPQKWQQLVKDLLRSNASNMSQFILEHLNAPQGDSTDVRFLHAAPAIEILHDFEDSDWNLEPLDEHIRQEHGHQEWDVAIAVHRKLHTGFQQVVNEAYDELHRYVAELDKIFGTTDIKIAFNEVDDLLQHIQHVYSIDADLIYQFKHLDADRLDSLLVIARRAMSYLTLRDRATFISKGYLEVVMPLRDHADYFEKFVAAMHKVQSGLRDNQISHSEIEEINSLIGATRKLYELTILDLSKLIGEDNTDAN